MQQIGKVIPIIIRHIELEPESVELISVNFDIKDGYWRMTVPPKLSYNFAYVLPELSTTEETMIMIPCALQMRWEESPAYFCSASEIARDVVNKLLKRDLTGKLLNNPYLLPAHPMEDMKIPKLLPKQKIKKQQLKALLEVYLDDFIALTCSNDTEYLRIISRILSNAIHSIFSPTHITNHENKDPISYKKIIDV